MHDQEPSVGKSIAGRVYAHLSLLAHLPDTERGMIESAILVSKLVPEEHFNVARLDINRQEVALLNYPTFFDDPFPSLKASWRVHLPTRGVSYRDYSQSLNPPVLHRKELLLPSAHPERHRLGSLTKLAEEIGLFDDPTRIGFRTQWLNLVASKGYAIVGHELVPSANNTRAEETELDPLSGDVRRHLTALSRTAISAPVQALLRHQLLRQGRTFFDYGCGKGDDVAALQELGFAAVGWDPYFKPNVERRSSDVVNLGFVINVIEDIEERIEALRQAYAITKGVISIAAMLWSTSIARGKPFGDGYLTSRNTFQKYYAQTDLQVFVESVLDEQAVPVAPGIFFAFKDPHLEQEFLARRHTDPTRTPRLLTVGKIWTPRATGRRTTPPRPARPLDPRMVEAADKIWHSALEFGRMPDHDEYPAAAEAVQLFGSWNRAMSAALQGKDETLLKAAALTRSNELRVFFALQRFTRRRALKDLGPRLRRDVKSFFGTVSNAHAEGFGLLTKCGSPEVIEALCTSAATQGLGWLDRDHSLQLHTSLVPRLDPILRIYIGCATVLYGDVSSADLVKIHFHSGKLTLMKFDDFAIKPLPRMTERVKLRFRDSDFDYFEYGSGFDPLFLYFKSRYMNEEFPNFVEQVAFDRQLEALGFSLGDNHGPTPGEFDAWLRAQRREVRGMRLELSNQLPALDNACGRNFTFRDLCECGETWERTRTHNVPQSADTYEALWMLATNVLDPVIDYFGGIKLTYGFASHALTRLIRQRIAPHLDQHASCEVRQNGRLLCDRRGAAVDFLVEYEDMLEVVRWIKQNCQFDRIYFYGRQRPIHVSVGPEASRAVFELRETNGRRVPRAMVL